MKKDFYDLLEIPENATPTWITRAYEQRMHVLESDASRSPAQRASMVAELGTAYRVLSSPLRRADYDTQRSKQRFSAERAASRRANMLRGTLLIGLPLLIAGGYLGYDHRQKENTRQAQLRDANAREQQLLAAKRRDEERLAAQERDRLESLRLEEERVERERRAREEEQRNKRFEVDTGYKTPEQLARERMQRENFRLSQQAQDELDRTRAALELERQKRFLRDSGVR